MKAWDGEVSLFAEPYGGYVEISKITFSFSSYLIMC